MSSDEESEKPGPSSTQDESREAFSPKKVIWDSNKENKNLDLGIRAEHYFSQQTMNADKESEEPDPNSTQDEAETSTSKKVILDSNVEDKNLESQVDAEHDPSPQAMSLDKKSEEPGPSSTQDKQEASTSKKVIWDSNVEDKDLESKKTDQKERRQSMVGSSGYVSQFLSEFLPDDPGLRQDDETPKPIREQPLQQRRQSLKAVEADMEYYMREASLPRPKRSSRALKILPATSSDLVPEEDKTDVSFAENVRPTSKWKPSDILEDKNFGVQLERSWVGTYIVGHDYWSDIKVAGDKAKIRHSVEEDKESWYDVSLSGEKLESKLWDLKSRSQSKMDVLKIEVDKEYEEKRKQRIMYAASARQEPRSTEEISEEFRRYFREVSTTSNARSEAPISMSAADKWLEKAGIVDHSHVTLIHTGLCFLASGGNRNLGLQFNAFIDYLEMIGQVCGKSLQEVVRRLAACQRGPDYTPSQTK